MPRKIVVFGSFVVDLASRASHLPVPGETVIGSRFKMGPGGKGSNQGVAAKRAGADVVMVTKVGRDAFGSLALDNFRQEGFDTRYILTDEDVETGTALIMVDEKTGQNKILVVSGACSNITADDTKLIEPLLNEVDILLTQLETNMDATERVIKIAEREKLEIVLNPAPVQPVSDEIYRKIACVTPNEVEASILTGITVNNFKDASRAAGFFFDRGVKNVVITLGEQGVYVSDGKKEEFIPSYKVEAVETTGAGDAFNGGFVTALAENKNVFEAALFGNAVGALSVTRPGTAPAMPYRHEIDGFMVRNELIREKF